MRISVKRSVTAVSPLMPIVAPPEPDSCAVDSRSSVWLSSLSLRYSAPNASWMPSDAHGLLHADVGEVAGDDALVDRLVDRALLQARDLQVVEGFLRHAADLEDVVRHAGRIGAVEHRHADRGAGGGIRNHVQRALDAVDLEVVQRPLVGLDLRVLHRSVVVPGVRDRAAHAEQASGTSCSRTPAGGRRLRRCDGQCRGLPNCSPAIVGRRAPEDAELLRRQERVVAVDRVRVEEVAARGDLGDRRVVGEHQLRVDVGVLGQLVVTHRAEAVATVRTLVVVRRTEVVEVRAGVERTERVAGRRVDRERRQPAVVEVARVARGRAAATVRRRRCRGSR